MLYFHVNNSSHKTYNTSLQPKYFTLPKQSGVLATEEDVTLNTLVSMIKKPSIVFPAYNSINFENSITFTKYERNPLYLGNKTHLSIQVALDSNFTNIIHNKKIADTNENNVTLSLPIDVSLSKIYIKIRYHSNLYSSPWSDTLVVTTKQFKINTPKINTPLDNSSAIVENVVVSTTAFNYVGITDTHASSTYQVSTNLSFSTLEANITTTTGLTVHSLPLAHSKTYYIRVRHNGNKYGSSNWSDPIRFTIPVFKINKPSVVSPTNGMTGSFEQVTISTSAFSYVGVNETHASTNYQVATTTDFENTDVIAVESATALRSYVATLSDNSSYYIRVRHNGLKYGSSDWSDPVKITIPKFKINTPTITSPANGYSGIVESITISTSAFSYVGVAETHISTTYQVARDTGFTNLVVNTTSATALLSYLVGIPNGSTYYIRVRHTGKKYGNSDWSPTFYFSIPAFRINTPTITSPANGGTGLNNNVVVSTTGLSFVGVGESLASVTYQIALDPGFTNLVVNSNIYAYSYTFTLGQGITYYIRVRHNGNKYGSSDWSGAVRISTVVPVTLLNGDVTITTTHSDNLNKTTRLWIYNDGTTVVRRRDDGGTSAGPKLFENVTGQQLYLQRRLISSYMGEPSAYGDVNTFYAPDITTPTAIAGQEVWMKKRVNRKIEIYLIFDYEIFNSSKEFLFKIRIKFRFINT